MTQQDDKKPLAPKARDQSHKPAKHIEETARLASSVETASIRAKPDKLKTNPTPDRIRRDDGQHTVCHPQNVAAVAGVDDLPGKGAPAALRIYGAAVIRATLVSHTFVWRSDATAEEPPMLVPGRSRGDGGSIVRR
jgi:hypothetical protein